MSNEFTRFREPTASERRLLAALMENSEGIATGPDWIDSVRIQSLEDGGMGSFRIASPEADGHHRVLGEVVSEGQFTDDDGVRVLVSLSVDSNGHPFEVDVWKSDFNPVVRFPDALEGSR